MTVPRARRAREQRGRSVPLVVVGHGAGAALLHGQAGLGAVEGLDLALLVDREDDGVGRRVYVKPHHVAQLLHELRVVGELEPFDPVRPQAVRAPDALHRGNADAGGLRHHRAGPVGRLGRRSGQGQRHHTLRHVRPEWRDARRSRPVTQQAIYTFSHEPRLPAPDAGLRLAGLAHDLDGPGSIGRRQNDARPPDMLLWAVPVRDDRFQSGTVCSTYLDGDTFAHPSRLAQGDRLGNPSSGTIH